MTLNISRHGLTLVVLTLAGVLASVVVATAQENGSRQRAPELHQVTSAVQDMQVIVRHRGDRMPPHTYTRFAPTQVRLDADRLVIVGTVTEAPADETADITIRMKTSGLRAVPHHSAVGKAWYEDDDLREVMERE